MEFVKIGGWGFEGLPFQISIHKNYTFYLFKAKRQQNLENLHLVKKGGYMVYESGSFQIFPGRWSKSRLDEFQIKLMAIINNILKKLYEIFKNLELWK